MSEEQPAPAPQASDIDYGLLLPFVAHVVLLQTMILIVRVTTSYRALELGLPVFWLGVIAAGFAIIPVFSAVPLGRDRSRQRRPGDPDRQRADSRSLHGFWLWSLGAASGRAVGARKPHSKWPTPMPMVPPAGR
jgi:hypothetical protein